MVNLNKANKVHSNKYDYSLVPDYVMCIEFDGSTFQTY